MSTHPDSVRRHSDGSIDLDRYRSEASALRRQAMQETYKLGAMLRLAVIIALTLGAVAAAPSKHDANATCRTCAETATVGAKTPSAAPLRRSGWTPVPQYPPVY